MKTTFSQPCFELVAKGKFCITNVILFTALALSFFFPSMALTQASEHRYGPKWRRRVIGNSWNGFIKLLSGISICLLKVCFEFWSAAFQSESISQLERWVAYLSQPFGPRTLYDKDETDKETITPIAIIYPAPIKLRWPLRRNFMLNFMTLCSRK